MKEMVLIASENSFNVTWLRQCLRDEGYSSVPCETAEEIIEELNTLPRCGVYVPVVVVEPEILKNISDDIVTRLSKCATDVPFVPLDGGGSLETFERICAHRAKFERDGNPLAKVLEEAGIEATCI